MTSAQPAPKDDDYYSYMMEWVLHVEAPVATIRFEPVQKPRQDFLEHHISLALALEQVRFDDRIRVVVISGRDDGSAIFELGQGRNTPPRPIPPEVLDPRQRPGGPNSLRGPWNLTQGHERAFMSLALMEKPVIGKMSGDAGAFSFYVLCGCDIVIADEDVVGHESHLAMEGSLPYGMTAGDGAFAFLSLFLKPTKLKEFLLLGPRLTGRDLAALGIVNQALPAAEVTSRVEELINDFLGRPPGPLARTKRAANKRLLQHMNRTLDYSIASMTNDLWELAAAGFVQDITLRPDGRS